MMQFNASVLLSALSPAARAAEPGIDRSAIIWMGLLMLLVFSLAWIWLKKTVYPQYREEINWKEYLLKVRDLVVMLDQKVILSNLFLELRPGRFYSGLQRLGKIYAG
jgi:hypothetical protein